MATNHEVFENWIKRKLKAHPDATELKVPHVIARHMPHCTCPKPHPARRVHMGRNATSGPQFWEYDSREVKLVYVYQVIGWCCPTCDIVIFKVEK